MTPAVLKAARALAKLTQKELASLACIATPTIADFERGVRIPHTNNLLSIMRVFKDNGIYFYVDSDGNFIGLLIKKIESNEAHPINM